MWRSGEELSKVWKTDVPGSCNGDCLANSVSGKRGSK